MHVTGALLVTVLLLLVGLTLGKQVDDSQQTTLTVVRPSVSTTSTPVVVTAPSTVPPPTSLAVPPQSTGTGTTSPPGTGSRTGSTIAGAPVAGHGPSPCHGHVRSCGREPAGHHL